MFFIYSELSKTRFSENHQENNHRQPSGIRIEIKQIPAERRRRGVLEICMEKLANFLKVFQRKPTPTRIMPLGNKNFRTMTSVLKFIRIMKENAKIHKKFKKLNSQHYSIINDNASLLPLQSKFFDKKVNKNHVNNNILYNFSFFFYFRALKSSIFLLINFIYFLKIYMI